MYSEKVMDHFSNPRNVGEIEDPSGVGTVGNAKCGDIMRMYLDIDDDGIIQDAKFKTFGCGAAVATSSMATELVKGRTVTQALEVTNKAVMEALDGLPPRRCTVPCLRRRRYTRRCGIMQRRMISASRVWRIRSNDRIFFTFFHGPVYGYGAQNDVERARVCNVIGFSQKKHKIY